MRRGQVGPKGVLLYLLGAVLAGASFGAAVDPDAPTVEAPAAPAGDTEAPTVEVPAPGKEAPAEAVPEKRGLLDVLPFELHGFVEGRAGTRTVGPVQEKDYSILETRFQLDAGRSFRWGTARAKLDLLGDAVMEHVRLEPRELNVASTPVNILDVKVGRQILTWGTGDLLFINDLFPKDWNSFFIGRDEEYLKSPSDALKLSAFTEAVNLDLVYVPQFNSDRFISGDRLSYYNDGLGRVVGEDDQVYVDKPRDAFSDDEFHARLSRTAGEYEFAAYGYYGFWKIPAGQNPDTGRYTFPKLAVYGASARGPVGPGIGNAEIGYYDSLEDRDGDDPFVWNSELRALVGYEQELAKELTGGVQWYLERMMGYGSYRRTLPQGAARRDEDRHVLTLRLTRLLLNQNLKLSLFTYWSPTDNDVYARPNVRYKITDNWSAEAGANVFLGLDRRTFFGQFEEDSNVYAGVRLSF